MEYVEWEPFYEEIIREFGYSKERDIRSSEILDKILRYKNSDETLRRIRNLLYSKGVVIFGAGPSLLRGIETYMDLIDNLVKISADGATTALIERGINPDVIVTDLDGKIDDIMNANRNGSFIVLHSHGDNIDNIVRYSEKFDKLIGTTQADPSIFKNLFNFGGFTDGDRSAFMAEHLGAKKIYLIGFDFNGRIGEYSFTKNIEIKKKKLKWCKKLLENINNVIFL